MNQRDWSFPDFVYDNSDFRIVYLCWRAVGCDRWDSTWLALDGHFPADWAFLYDPDEHINW